MPYVSSFERLAKEEARVEALQKTVLRQGQHRFGEPAEEVVTAVTAISDVDRLERLTVQLLDVGTWRELLDTR